MMMDFLHSLFAVDWSGLVTAAVASGAGLTVVTQLLKTKWVSVPASKYPRAVTAALAVLVGIIGTLAAGLELSSLTSLVVFAVVSFIVSGLTYDGVRGLVSEIKHGEPEAAGFEDPEQVIELQFQAGPLLEEAKAPVKLKPTVEEVAQQIVDGVGGWGNGDERRKNVRAAGYSFNEVQAKVKELVAKK